MFSDLAALDRARRLMASSSLMLRMVLTVAAVAGVGTAFARSTHHGTRSSVTETCTVRHARPVIQTHVNTRGDVLGIDVVGLTGSASRLTADQWAASFQVRTSEADTSLPSVAGRYAWLRDTIRFTAAYPLVPGQTYHVRLDGGLIAPRAVLQGGAGDCDAAPRLIDTTIAVAITRTLGDRTEVLAVYPTVDVLPMNQLKLYVHFSAPMRTGEASAHTRIIDETDGRVVPDAFFSFDEELWDQTQTRLTLLFDPGRIKRGLMPNEELGLPLRAGRRYRLVIDAAWTDANGNSLRKTYVKRFAVAAPNRVAPRAARWSVTTPRAGTSDTLSVSFGEPMDEALLERLLVVRDSSGTPVAGKVVIARGEDRRQFVPASQWRAGRYAIDVGTDLEDLAGNNLRRLFDTDLRNTTAPTLEHADHVSVPVIIRKLGSQSNFILPTQHEIRL
jgi:hypothetical protein